MGPAVAQQLSPELVLVCPELRARALELLPARDPDALFRVEPRPPQRAELRLVPPRREDLAEPELEQHASRPMAVAAYFAEALVLGTLRGAAMIATVATVAFLLAR